jgi:carbonic anhydrase
MLIHHTDCGMLTFGDDDFRRQVQADTGIKPEWAAESFSDIEEDVRQSIARINASPFVPNKEQVRGFVYEVETGQLREVN